MKKSQYAMIFYPKNAYVQNKAIDQREQMIARLTDEGFLGKHFSVNYDGQKETRTGYLIGDNFLKLITFLGCSPHLAVALPENKSDWSHFCHIEIQQNPKPVFFKGLNNPKCSCPQCKSRITKQLPEMQQWLPASMNIVCPKCHKETLLEDLDWRHSAGFGLSFIIIHSVYPSEAVPTESLLKLFKSEPFNSYGQWDYFFYEQ